MVERPGYLCDADRISTGSIIQSAAPATEVKSRDDVPLRWELHVAIMRRSGRQQTPPLSACYIEGEVHTPQAAYSTRTAHTVSSDLIIVDRYQK